jgi:pyridoxal phosphate enzyme (YggS family)
MPGVADNLARVRDQIAASIARRGPGPAVTLIGVGKKQPVAALHAALAAGLHDLGENYAQEFASKHADPLLAALTPRWHFIGALQSNKTRLVVGRAIIHTVDRPSLVTTLAARARALACTQEILVEVNLGGEAQKAGVAPDALPALLDAIAHEAGALRCLGLTLIPPADDDPERARPHFAALRELASRAGGGRPHIDLRELSMGMSGDFAIAIAEGATMVRIGTAIFGARPPAAHG